MYYEIPCKPLPRLTEIYYVTRNTTWRCMDKNNLLVFVKQGCCYFNVNSHETLLNTGEAIFIPSSTPYIRRSFEETMCTLCYVHFMTDTSPIEISDAHMGEYALKIMEEEAISSIEKFDTQGEHEQIFIKSTMSFKDNTDSIFSWLNEIRNDKSMSDDPYRCFVASLSLAKLLAHFSREVIKDSDVHSFQKNLSLPTPLQRALLYIQKNYRKKISSQALADAAKVSPQHLIRLFKTHIGSTPVEYINKVKIFHALDMMRCTDMSIKEIAYELGFEDQNYFNRMFKKKEGISPLERKKQIQNFDKNKSTPKV